MFGLPQELTFVLVFGAFLLVRFLYRSLRRAAASVQAQTTPELPDEPEQPTAARTSEARRMAPPRSPPQTAAPRAAPPLASRAPRRARRYTRAALMPDRRTVQDAIVIAAILQPCHAQRPNDVG